MVITTHEFTQNRLLQQRLTLQQRLMELGHWRDACTLKLVDDADQERRGAHATGAGH